MTALASQPSATSVAHFADFQGLGRLRQQAAADPEATAREAAMQFEALLIQDLLSAARLTDDDLPLMGQQTRQYQDMFEQQVALDMARKGGFGLADHILQGLGHNATTPATVGLSGPITDTRSPQAQFLQELAPLAQRAGEKLGISPRLVLAQAALETGWGRTTEGADGGSARHNYFGIKATDRWSGERIEVQTVEFRNGVPLRERASFRAYQNPAESFSDYEDVLQQGRYVQARNVGDDARAFADGLMKGGYATDPAYADKLVAIAESDIVKRAVSAGYIAQEHGLRADNRTAR